MKLQQLRYALEVYRHNLNVSEAADALFTSQPGVSKQIRLLEEELGIQIFIRSGKRIISVSQPGKAVLQMAERILHDIQNIKNIGNEFAKQDTGTLTIATTHAQARYVLPRAVSRFVADYPKVRLNIRQGTPEGIVQMVASGGADFAISSELPETGGDLRRIPCSRWHYGLLLPDSHPLLDHKGALSIPLVAQYPLITYEFAFNPGTSIARAFNKAGVQPNVALSVMDADVLKTYVRLGLGIGIMAKIAYDAQADSGLTLVDISQLIEPCHTSLLLRADSYLRGYIYDFIELFEPELTKGRLEQLLYSPVVEDFSI
ncbi:MAG: CysB family HTH-type transcriptional regulator [Neisseria sp.]|nr:CysB family HTH-type transcriptional regulator [Neisseria sp.]